MTHEATLLDHIDPDAVKELETASRRGLFSRAALRLGGLASAPLVLAQASNEAFGFFNAPSSVTEVLNFALTLEYLEAEFYTIGLARPGLIPGRFRPVFQQLAKHETAHVRTLRGALGPNAIAKPTFDFTARGRYPDVFTNFATYSQLSQTFEDLGVAAYKGQAGNLKGTPLLTTALRIHSVEARHAAEIRRINGVAPWDGAFDSPLTRAAVLSQAAPFIVSPPA